MNKKSKPKQGIVFVVLLILSMRLFGGMQAEAPEHNTETQQEEVQVDLQEDAQTSQAEEKQMGVSENDSATTQNVSVVVSANAVDDTISKLEVHFLDVGQGDATLIVNDEYTMLIDAGDDSKGTTIQNYLQKQGIEKLNYLILTHQHEDHIGGADVILTKFEIDTLIMTDDTMDTAAYRNVIDAMEYRNIQNILPVVGAEYTLGDANFTIIAPIHNNYGDNINNRSIGLLLQHGENRFLFTGDAEADAEWDLLQSGMDLSCDVYQAGHHGSSTSSTAAFMEKVLPKYAVISCADGNDYGQPHAEVLNTLRENGVKLFRTDEQGTVVVISDGEQLTWNCAPSQTWKVGETN
ncbi:MAG: MBL fold metallo-hydrolase [Lachnospiraceae bacterium]|nr:MBL fold metallo-hydrolase [Lachnospiraceae bacterium]